MYNVWINCGKLIILVKERKFLMILSICVILSGLWYSNYTKNSIVVFAPDETVYYYNVKTQTEFLDQLNKDKIININTADIESLDSLKGIGVKTAENIIEYRTKNGPFKSIEEIMNVSGIGESKFNDIKDFISVEGDSWYGV